MQDYTIEKLLHDLQNIQGQLVGLHRKVQQITVEIAYIKSEIDLNEAVQKMQKPLESQ